MKSSHKYLAAIFSFTAMGLLILDTKTALQGAAAGVELCIRTVIPSLFPFFVITIMLTGTMLGKQIPFLNPVGKVLGMPGGSESLLMVGMLGGYPVGAQCIGQGVRSGSISQTDAARMFGFCSNAGPAFLFGMAGNLFSTSIAPWVLWITHILSAIAVGLLLPQKSSHAVSLPSTNDITLSAALKQSVRVIAEVCGWILVFRVVIAFSERWFLWLLPKWVQVLIVGLLELSNGCVGLLALPQEGLRFILCALFLGLGGVCVGMQTISVTEHIGTGMYFPGKLMQAVLSLLIAFLFQPIIFSADQQIYIHPAFILVTLFATVCLGVFLGKNEKNSRKILTAHV